MVIPNGGFPFYRLNDSAGWEHGRDHDWCDCSALFHPLSVDLQLQDLPEQDRRLTCDFWENFNLVRRELVNSDRLNHASIVLAPGAVICLLPQQKGGPE
jgi:hypothetical protein